MPRSRHRVSGWCLGGEVCNLHLGDGLQGAKAQELEHTGDSRPLYIGVI